jgi:peptide/nickel transport system permease protein
LAVLLIALFGIQLRWLPLTGYVSPLTDPGDALRHLLMPVFTLSTFYLALTARLVRSSVLEALSEDYVRTARAKGLHARAVLVRHATRTALIPAATAVGINIAYLFGGSIVVEEIFAIPGLGRLLLTAVVNRDFR